MLILFRHTGKDCPDNTSSSQSFINQILDVNFLHTGESLEENQANQNFSALKRYI